MVTDWRLLDTGVLAGSQNMALDDIILECHAENKTPNTIRFLQFNPPATLIGYHQSVEQEIRLDFIRRNNVDVNRRITGGGAILFTTTCLGWEVFADKASPGIDDLRYDLDQLARRVCSGPIKALNELGIEATFRPKNDIEINGRKISGTGGTQRGDSFLYQGTLLIDFDVNLMLKSLRIPLEKLKDKEVESVKERVTWLGQELGYIPPIEKVKDALVRGFEEVFDISLQPSGLTIDEKNLYSERLPYFESDEWINLVQKPRNIAGHVTSARKTPGGLIRVSLALNLIGNYIVSSFITGDFQVFPQRAILDLEAKLKNSPTDDESIRMSVEMFFKESNARIYGIEPEDVVQLLIEAIKKQTFVDWGVTPEDANHLMTVNFMADELHYQNFDYILLPYCAKLVDCIYRRVEGCSLCGSCTISDIYEIVEEYGIPVRTIQNFEHLIETIKEFKEKGARGYIGSCCEAFHNKHYLEFIDTGVPALLIDIDDSTCYELGEEREAYIGEFEGQTLLKTDLLIMLIRGLWDKGILKAEVDLD